MSQDEVTTLIDLKQSAILPSSAMPIRRKSIHRCLGQIFACCLILVLPAAGQDAVSQIKAEANRLQQSFKDKPFSVPELPNASAVLEGAVKSVKEAADAGRVYRSLEQLDQLAGALQGARTAAEKSEAAKKDFSGFENEWKKVSLDVEGLDQKARQRNWTDAQAAIRALSETAQAKAVPLLESGRGFAAALGPENGLTYLGQAQAEAEFAQFCASLNLPRKGVPYVLRSMLPEIENLQEKATAAFQPPRSIELHSTFINLNSALKFAQELDAQRFYAGALYKYLEAVRQYGLLDAPAPDPGRQSELNGAMARMREQLDASGYDDSIAQIFLDRAESQVRHGDGSAPSGDEWKSTAVIIDQVLPAYFAAKQPPAALPRASGKAIDITLVRWPYT